MASASHFKSVLKAVSWRFVGALDTFILVLIVTGTAKIAGPVMGFEVFTKSFLYYAHERAWELPLISRIFEGLK